MNRSSTSLSGGESWVKGTSDSLFLKKNFNIYFLDPVGSSMTDDSTNVTRADAGAFSEIYDILCNICFLWTAAI